MTAPDNCIEVEIFTVYDVDVLWIVLQNCPQAFPVKKCCELKSISEFEVFDLIQPRYLRVMLSLQETSSSE